jgi:MurNAc alpha-1-phosphate uridylyltransferase
MKAMILAAGRGVRMRPLTDSIPKCLLPVRGRPLITYLIEQLRRGGFGEIVINVSHLGTLVESALGDGAAFGVRIAYSREAEPLETAGGIAAALPLLGSGAFAVANGDVYSDFEFARLRSVGCRLAPEQPAHLVLVGNPVHHPEGDYCLRHGMLALEGGSRLTFSGIGAYHPSLFGQIAPHARCQLAALLREPIARARVSGEEYAGMWQDVGTPQRLAELERHLAAV